MECATWGAEAPDIEAAPGLGGSYPEPQRKGVRKTGSSLLPSVKMKRGRSESQRAAKWGHSTASSHGEYVRRSPTSTEFVRLLKGKPR